MQKPKKSFDFKKAAEIVKLLGALAALVHRLMTWF